MEIIHRQFHISAKQYHFAPAAYMYVNYTRRMLKDDCTLIKYLRYCDIEYILLYRIHVHFCYTERSVLSVDGKIIPVSSFFLFGK